MKTTMMMWTALPLLLFGALVTAHDTILSVHGSGTTNPSKCYWLIMDQIMDRAKGPVRLTYRAVGSSTGQEEFIGASTSGVPDNDFGSGDIPISTEAYNNLTAAGVEFVHLPIVLGAISLFHSVPNISSESGQGLNLTACVIARIFKREITTWDHEDVVAMNPHLDLPSEGYPITVAHRVLGSSSTASVTEYLRKTCPQEWPEDLVGSTIEWPEDTKPCEGSGGMTECIKTVEGTIGYIDSGHGHEEGLNEIELENADGTYLSSKEAGTKGGVAAAAGDIPASADMDFGEVNLLNRPGEFTWPIVAMTYVYVRKDLSHIDSPQEQTLLKAFLTALYDPDYINQCIEQFDFTAVPEEVRQIGLDGIAMLITATNATDWTFESETVPGDGQGDYVISVKRRTFAEYQLTSLDEDTMLLQTEITNLREELNEEKAKVANMTEELQSIRQQVGTSGGGSFTTSSSQYADFTEDEAGQISAALIMSSLSIVFWALALAVVGFRHFFRPNKDVVSGDVVASGSAHGKNSAHGVSAAAHAAALDGEHVT